MSHTLYVGQDLVVGTFCGPEDPAEPSRRRWQFVVRDSSDMAALTDGELAQLLAALIEHLAVGLGR